MPAPLQRIGRALLKFFKPIRVTLPHQAGGKPEGVPFDRIKISAAPFDEAASPRVIKLNPNPKEGPKKEAGLPIEAAELPPLPEKAPTHWLELVLYLLTACKKASEKMRRKTGVNAYQKAVQAKGRGKLKALGNIVDTNVDEEKEAA